ncbi:MAG TPA: hypothetical protein VF062_11150 [Candidatus Limnocylindrales bacterium]
MERDLSREAAERLLSGDSTPPPEGAERLAALLAAAAAPARPDELAGEAAAMAAFRAHPPTVRRWSLRRALTIKVAAVVAATVAAGGVALASTTGLLPNPFSPPKVEQSPSVGPSSGVSPTPGAGQSPDQHGPGTEGLKGLCRAYQAKADNERGKSLQTPAFEALVKAANGIEHVPAFCENLLAERPAKPDNPADNPPDRRPSATPPAPQGAPPTTPPMTPKGLPTKASR